MHKDIETWLANPADYPAGLALYKPHCKSDFLFSVLSGGESAYNLLRLKEELAKVIAADAPPPPKTSLKKEFVVDFVPDKPEPVKYGRKAQHFYPEELHPAFERQNKLYQQVNHLHPQLDLLHQLDQGKCKDACKAIIAAWDELHAIYRLLDYWEANKVILPNKYGLEEPVVYSNPEQIRRRIQNLAVYISRNRNKIDKAPDVLEWRSERESLIVKLQASNAV